MVEKLERSKEMEGDGTGVGVWRQSWGLSAMVMSVVKEWGES